MASSVLEPLIQDKATPKVLRSPSKAPGAIANGTEEKEGELLEPLVFAKNIDGDWECEDAKAAVRETKEVLTMTNESYSRLYDFQVRGVEWLWGLWSYGLGGGVLGDDMGMGKTVQICSFIGTMWTSKIIGKVLLVVPASLISVWERSMEEWCKDVPVGIMVGGEAPWVIKSIKRGGRFGVVLTTYETLRGKVGRVVRALEKGDGEDFDLVVLDEGHRIKNHKAQISKAIREVPAIMRVVVTGTPMQNNLTEFWAIFDFVTEGCLLGSDLKEFRARFERDIKASREKGASYYARKVGEEKAQVLRELISPHFLRRKKTLMDEAAKRAKENGGGNAAPAELPKKRDIVVWARLAPEQEKLYRTFLQSKVVREILDSSNSPLSGLTVLQKICDHPQLCANQWTANMKDDADRDDIDEISELLQGVSLDDNGEALVQSSVKLKVLKNLLRQFASIGSRSIIFSKSTKMLDIIENVIVDAGYNFCRIDGSTPTISRQKIVDDFNETPNKVSIMLITKGVGGVGLTLTGADRVVLFDPAWNPVVDEQAVDRIYRIGQTKDVVCCRLITCGTIEDKMYRRQVYKAGIAEMVTKGRSRKGRSKREGQRHFSSDELREIFSYDSTIARNTLKLLQQTLSSACTEDQDLNARFTADKEAVDSLRVLPGVEGLSHHGLVQYTHQAVENIDDGQVRHHAVSQNSGRATTAEYTNYIQQPMRPRDSAEKEFDLDKLPSPPRKSNTTVESKSEDIETGSQPHSVDFTPFALRAAGNTEAQNEIEVLTAEMANASLDARLAVLDVNFDESVEDDNESVTSDDNNMNSSNAQYNSANENNFALEASPTAGNELEKNAFVLEASPTAGNELKENTTVLEASPTAGKESNINTHATVTSPESSVGNLLGVSPLSSPEWNEKVHVSIPPLPESRKPHKRKISTSSSESCSLFPSNDADENPPMSATSQKMTPMRQSVSGNASEDFDSSVPFTAGGEEWPRIATKKGNRAFTKTLRSRISMTATAPAPHPPAPKRAALTPRRDAANLQNIGVSQETGSIDGNYAMKEGSIEVLKTTDGCGQNDEHVPGSLNDSSPLQASPQVIDLISP